MISSQKLPTDGILYSLHAVLCRLPVIGKLMHRSSNYWGAPSYWFLIRVMNNSFDQEYQSEPSLRDLPLTILNVPRLLLLALIRLYQMTLSRGLPPNTCRFYPSCSHYGYQAIYKHGVIKGGIMAAWRVIRCNPFNPGGYDPVQ